MTAEAGPHCALWEEGCVCVCVCVCVCQRALVGKQRKPPFCDSAGRGISTDCALCDPCHSTPFVGVPVAQRARELAGVACEKPE